MDFNHIKNYLDKFKGILFLKEEILEIISKSIEKSISIKIEVKSIQIKRNIIYIKTSPLIKNEILINKDEILRDISLLSPQNKFKDIR